MLQAIFLRSEEGTKAFCGFETGFAFGRKPRAQCRERMALCLQLPFINSTHVQPANLMVL